MNNGELFKNMRTELGLNQGGFAALLRIDSSHLSKIENNRANPSETLMKLAQMIYDQVKAESAKPDVPEQVSNETVVRLIISFV